MSYLRLQENRRVCRVMKNAVAPHIHEATANFCVSKLQRAHVCQELAVSFGFAEFVDQ